MQRSYEKGVTDEFIEPVTIVDARGEPVGLIRDDDACIFFNFRADRGREMTEALTSGTLESPSRSTAPKNLHFATMTQYDKSLPCPSCCRKEPLDNILANVFAQLNWKNLRVAETEKYAHVTYFFNGGMEKPFAGEEREMVPSPKVATYDLKPEMSAEGVAEVVLRRHEQARFRCDRDELRQRRYGGALRENGADGARRGNGRRVPGQIWQRLKEKNGRWIITADHGNAETMIDPVTHGPHTYHTTNPVPLILVDDSGEKLRPGRSAAGHRPDDSGRAGRKAAERDDRPGFEDSYTLPRSRL